MSRSNQRYLILGFLHCTSFNDEYCDPYEIPNIRTHAPRTRESGTGRAEPPTSPVLYVAQLDESFFDEYPHWRQYIEQ